MAVIKTKDRNLRQVRSMPTEFRAAEEEGKKIIEGYFAVFGDVYELWPGATESVDPHAFDEALDGDIRALIDHQTHLVLGRNKSGTLDLKVDNRGLWGRIEVNDYDTDATNLYARVQRGDVTQCSFGFDLLEENTDLRPDGTVHWTIKKVKLYEVSCVTFPAYKDTSITARQDDYAKIKKRQLDAWRSTMKARIRNGT